MTRTFEPNDLQLILLATAAQRDNGSLLLPSDILRGQDERVRKAIPQLIKHALVTEARVDSKAESVRQEDDAYIGLVITRAGRAAIAIVDTIIVQSDATKLPGVADDASYLREAPTFNAAPARTSKIGHVTELLRRPGGGSLTELTSATNWLPHTVRAALTGLRKKGHAIERSSQDGITIYTLAS